MHILALETEPLVVDVAFSPDSSSPDSSRVIPEDGRELTVPLAWFPRLMHATPDQRPKGN